MFGKRICGGVGKKNQPTHLPKTIFSNYPHSLTIRPDLPIYSTHIVNPHIVDVTSFANGEKRKNTSMAETTTTSSQRQTFDSRLVFLMAAIGSAVGLGNIWRFPYVAYENGGGAFLIPYLVALLTAGIPILWFDFTVGHRWRASAPLAFRRLSGNGEVIGWFKVGVSFFIAVYYAAIVAWAAIYTVKSFTKAWGADPETHLFNDFLQADTTSTFSGEYVMPILLVMIAVWVFSILVLALNVNSGIGKLTVVFVPVLVVLFAILVVRALFLEGAAEGLNAFFTPNWGALKDSSVWIAAYGQIFFSLSVGFGIMLTYASYLKPRTNLTGTGLVTAFANSSFEVLAGIGVFATLGFMAHSQGVGVDEVATNGIGLAFVAFPTIINNMPFGEFFGVLFFLSLFLAGITSLISIMEVVFSAINDKLGWTRAKSAIIIGSLMAIISTVLFASTSGLMALDIMDKWTNNLGIVFCAIVALVMVAWVTGRRNEITQHLNAISSVRVGMVYQLFAFVVTPLILVYFLYKEISSLISEGYGDYAANQLNIYGWAVVGIIVLNAIIWTFIPFRNQTVLSGVPGSDYGVPNKGRAKGEPNTLVNTHMYTAAGTGTAATGAATSGKATSTGENPEGPSATAHPASPRG